MVARRLRHVEGKRYLMPESKEYSPVLNIRGHEYYDPGCCYDCDSSPLRDGLVWMKGLKTSVMHPFLSMYDSEVGHDLELCPVNL